MVPVNVKGHLQLRQEASQCAVSLPDRFMLEPSMTVSSRWDHWVESFKYFWDAAGMFEEKKRAVLLHAVGPDVQALFHGLKEDADIKDGFERALAALTAYFHPRKNTRYERYLFSKMSQSRDETIDAFLSRLRSQARHCVFLDEDDRLLDQIVHHCASEKLRDRLLVKGDDLTLDVAVKVARTLEAVMEQSAVMSRSTVSTLRAQHYKAEEDGSDSDRVSGQQRKNRKKFMEHCSPRMNREESTEHCSPQKVSSADEGEEEVVYVSKLSAGRRTSLFTTLMMSGQPCRFLLDSGAVVNIVSKGHVPSGTQLDPPGCSVVMYDGSPLKILGQCVLRVQNPKNKRRYDVLFHVVESGTCLLNSRAMLKMRFIKITGYVYRLSPQDATRTNLRDESDVQLPVSLIKRTGINSGMETQVPKDKMGYLKGVT